MSIAAFGPKANVTFEERACHLNRYEKIDASKVKGVWHQLMLRYHPDKAKWKDKDLSKEITQELVEAKSYVNNVRAPIPCTYTPARAAAIDRMLAAEAASLNGERVAAAPAERPDWHRLFTEAATPKPKPKPKKTYATPSEAFAAAVRDRDQQEARRVYEQGGVDLNQKDDLQRTLFLRTIDYGLPDLAIELIKSGQAPLDVPDANGATPLLHAINWRRPQVAIALIATGKVALNKPDAPMKGMYVWGPLKLAIIHGLQDVALALLEHDGVDTDRNSPQRSARRMAYGKGMSDVVAAIDKYEAEGRDRPGPLHL